MLRAQLLFKPPGLLLHVFRFGLEGPFAFVVGNEGSSAGERITYQDLFKKKLLFALMQPHNLLLFFGRMPFPMRLPIYSLTLNDLQPVCVTTTSLFHIDQSGTFSFR